MSAKLKKLYYLSVATKETNKKVKIEEKSNDCKIEIHHFNRDKSIWTCYHDWIINLDSVILIDKMIDYLTK